MGFDVSCVDDFDRRLAELKSDKTPRFLARSTRGTWEFFTHAPVLGSGPYVELMSSGVVRRLEHRTTSDISYLDL